MFRIIFGVLLIASIMSCSDSPVVDQEPAPVQDEHLLLPWAEISGRIAIKVDRIGGTWVIDANARSVRYLGDIGSYTSGLDISPNGQALALEYVVGGPYGYLPNIRVAATNGAIAKWDQKPAEYGGSLLGWRPNGQLSFWRGDTIYSEHSVLAQVPTPNGRVCWSADGEEILVTYWDGVARSRYVQAIRISDGRVRDVARGVAHSYWMSPVAGVRGDSIILKYATEGQAGDEVGELWIMGADGSGKRLITATPVGVYDVSPDGDYLVAAGWSHTCAGCPPPLEPGLHLIRIDDGSIRKLMIMNVFDVAWGR